MTIDPLIGYREDLRDIADQMIIETLAYLREHGVDCDEMRAHCGVFSLVRARFDGPWFDFVDAEDPDGVDAFCFEILGDDDVSVRDLGAWPIDRPDQFATMFGRASIVGAGNVFNAATYSCGDRLMIWRTPLSWLQANCAGAVILNFGEASRILIDASGLLGVEDDLLFEQISAAFEQLDYRGRVAVRNTIGTAA